MGGGSSTPAQNIVDWERYIENSASERNRAYDLQDVLTNYNPEEAAQHITIKEKKAYRVTLPFVLEDNLNNEYDPQNNKILHINLQVRFINEESCSVKVDFLAREDFDKNGKFLGIISDKPSKNFVVEKRDSNFKIDVDIEALGIRTSTKKEKRNHIIIFLTSLTSPISLIHHFRLEFDSEIKVFMTRRIMLNGEEFIELRPAFGLKNTPLFGQNSEEKCIICITNSPTTMIEPCQHVCLCNDCAADITIKTTQCPVCRGVINYLVKII